MSDQTIQPAAGSPTMITLYYQPAFFSSFVQAASGCPPLNPTQPDITPEITLWIRHPALLGYNPAGATRVNLKRTPNAYDPNAYDPAHPPPIDIDDHVHEYGCTAFGPSFPQAYASGGVYLSESLVKLAILNDYKACHPDKSTTSVTVNLTTYPVDETIIVSWTAPFANYPAGKPTRYHGFYAKRLGMGQYQNLWVVWQPGAWRDATIPMGEQWRAPRKLWIPSGVVLDTTGLPSPPTEIGQYIYLEQNYATQIANLDVPKQPSGSGQGLLDLIQAASPDPAASPRSTDPNVRATATPRAATTGSASSLNVLSEYTPGEMGRIKQIVNPQVRIAPEQTLTSALLHYLENHPDASFDNLDLIGHSRSRDRILKLGELALTARVAKTEFSRMADFRILENLKIKRIRLLGCRTASHARGRHVARVIHQLTRLPVSAARTDLFAVHYDGSGLRPEARSLLADYEVISAAGPGDNPPSDDYPGALIPDDDDEHEDPIIPHVPKPSSFSLAALSDVNAAMVAAQNYLFWNDYTLDRFKQLGALLQAGDAQPENPMLRAEYEVLVPISGEASMTFMRSFDLFLMGPQPRIRVNVSQTAFSFRFRDNPRLRQELQGLHIPVK